jgi:hypothetical protein
LAGCGFIDAEAQTRTEAIGEYWDLYHGEIDRLLRQYPDRVRKFTTVRQRLPSRIGLKQNSLTSPIERRIVDPGRTASASRDT